MAGILRNMNDNTVTLLGHYGDDATIACSAWTSTYRDLTPDKIERIPKLLKDLADADHHTPFEKSSIHFLVDTDIASHIHCLKSRIGVSINSESARYKELKEDKFYLPKDWDGILASDNAEEFDHMGAELDIFERPWIEILKEYTELGNILYHASLRDVGEVLGRKRAKESARYFKTYNSQIQADVMFNWRSLNHFLGLRTSQHAQKEIRDIATKMLDLVKNIEGNPFEHTIKAFGL